MISVKYIWTGRHVDNDISWTVLYYFKFSNVSSIVWHKIVIVLFDYLIIHVPM